MASARPTTPGGSTLDLLRAHVTPFASANDSKGELGRYFDSFGASRVLLIGDASHGTSEFYAVRAEMTKYMIERHGFNVVAIEADWPDAEAVDRYVRRRSGPGPEATVQPHGVAEKAGREAAFLRFPTWMWRNQEVGAFVEWLRAYNEGREAGDEASVGLYGLDLYSLKTSMRAVVRYLEGLDPSMAALARQRYGRLMVWAEDPHEYGLETLVSGFEGCEREVVAVLRDLLDRKMEYSAQGGGDAFHSAEQNARLVVDAEHYYKAMYHGRDESWNVRDRHMFETLVRLLKHRGPSAKAVVWAHNSHVGDARATEMGCGGGRDELNIGQLCRETFGGSALSIGCGGYAGTVAAAERWDGDMRVMRVRPGLPGSYEELMHHVGVRQFALDLREGRCDKGLRGRLMRARLERFIGVVYRPEEERAAHYARAALPGQFDGFVWFDESRHVGALEVHQPRGDVEYDETWPSGL